MPSQPASERFSRVEMEQRWEWVRGAMEAAQVDHLLVFGQRGNHHDVLYLSGFPVSHEAVLVWPREGEPRLLVSYSNHVPNARRLSWFPADDLTSDAVGRLAGIVPHGARVGVAGPLSWQRRDALAAGLGLAAVADLAPAFARRRLVKSPAEVARIRAAAELSDRAVTALQDNARPGLSEYELAQIVEDAYLGAGATTHIHYIGVTAMADPDLCVPAQVPSGRVLAAGDVILTEISAQLGGYYGQVLRTFTVASAATPEYHAMHRVAREIFDRIEAELRPGLSSRAILDVADLIERSGYTICDDLVHMAVGGVYAPFLRTRASTSGSPADFEFLPGMIVVVQPNVVTNDQRSGVQFGEMFHLTPEGCERLHRAERDLLRCG